MERGGLAKAFGKLTDSFRSCMVEEYMKSYLSHSGSDAVILMKREAENVVMKIADMEVRSDGIFLRYKSQNSDTQNVSAGAENVDKVENGLAASEVGCLLVGSGQDFCLSIPTVGQEGSPGNMEY